MLAAVAAIFVLTASGVAAQPEPGGYGPNEPVTPGVPGGYTAVVTAATISQDGAASLSGTVEGGSVSVEAPVGALPTGVQVRVTTASTSAVDAGISGVGYAGHSAVATAGVNVYNADGTKYTGSFAKPVAVTITGPRIKSGDIVVRLDSGTSASKVPATVSPGTAAFSISEDPNLAVLTPAAAGAGQRIVGATEVQTGATEAQNGGEYPIGELTALAVVLIGVVSAITGVVLRRRSAQAS